MEVDKIAELEENWDGYGGLPCACVNSAAMFEMMLENVQGITDIDIDPNPNGTVTFSWVFMEKVYVLEVGKSRMVGCINGKVE